MHHALQVLSVAKDQNGCRFLQRKFDEGGSGAIGSVFPEVLDNLIELMVDPFGNYLIQKLLDRCSEEQRLQVCFTHLWLLLLGTTQGQLTKSPPQARCKYHLQEGFPKALSNGFCIHDAI